MTAPAAGSAATFHHEETVLPLQVLTLDPALQARTGVSEEKVAEYAEAMTAGEEFPAIEVIHAGKLLLVVDGWHRVLAGRRAGLAGLAAKVRTGTPDEALDAAVGANARHGLARTPADKRRAVVMLLRHPGRCRLASREIRDLAGVSHTLVNDLREKYGVKVGEVLEEDRIAEVDGELPERYRKCCDGYGANTFRPFVLAIRAARDIPAIAAQVAKCEYSEIRAAAALRLDELARTSWPWRVDTTDEQRVARAGCLDSAKDLEVAILARECPDRAGLFAVWRLARKIGRLGKYEIDNATRELKGRPSLLAAVRDRKRALDLQEQEEIKASPWRYAEQLAKGPPAVLREVLREAPDKLLEGLCAHLKQITDGMPHDVVEVLHDRVWRLGKLQGCPDPTCPGWTWKGARCSWCETYPDGRARGLTRALVDAGRLVEAGRPLQVGDVRVDRSAVRVLSELDASARVGELALRQWIDEGPPDLAAALRELLEARAHREDVEEVLVEEEPDEDAGEDLDEDEEDLDEDEEDLDEDEDLDGAVES